MKKLKPLIIVLFIGFTAYTGYIAYVYGYTSVLKVAFSSLPAIQLYLDLAIALLLMMIWMISDVQKEGKSWLAALPYIAITLVFGVIGPLLYLVCKKYEE